MMKRGCAVISSLIGIGVLLVVLAALVIQLVPYGKDHTNPPVIAEPPWDSPETRALAKRACFDCHSNETVWPAYSRVAPVSWLVYRDVVEGREELNFSEWGTGEFTEEQDEEREEGEAAEEIGETISEGEMPPAQYLLLHPEADLSPQERQSLISGFERTLQ